MKKILYFVRGVPTHAELMEAQDNYALIRDYTAWHDGDCLEVCDAVMGKAENIPMPYKHLWQGVNKEPEKPVNEPVDLSETEPVSENGNIQPIAARGRRAGKAVNTPE